jgi:hypothetical protein
MVCKTQNEIDEMRQNIQAGKLPPNAIEQYLEAEEKAVFGHDVKYDEDGEPIEQGIGSFAQPSQNSIDAYIKTQTERRVGGPEPGFNENVEAMRARLAEYQAERKAKAAAAKKLAAKAVG